VIVEFKNAQGIIVGTPVRYRGVPIGKVIQLRQGARSVEVRVEISSGDLLIPADARIAVNQSGLVSSAYLDITPTSELTEQALAMNPHGKDCDSRVIVCKGDRLKGVPGRSIDQLIQIASRLAERLNDDELFKVLKDVAKNSSDAAAGVAKLTNELAELSKVSKQELQAVSGSVRQTTVALNRTLEQTSQTVERFGKTADQLTLTASQVSSLLEANRSTLILTLDNLNQTTRQLRIAMTELTPAISRISQGELLANLEALSANTAKASANLRDVTNLLNSPSNLLMLQQTLDSARSTFQNVEKITSDLDELTGDPQLRQNLRNLINGLSGLVSSTQQLEQQTDLVYTLSTLASATSTPSTTPLQAGPVTVSIELQRSPTSPLIITPLSVTSPATKPAVVQPANQSTD
jgi:phospholipid/cholesterol/gamma-HCH transport system substrate-binding protein